jgi:hypothetical protein
LLPGFLVGRAAAGERCLGRSSGLIVFAAGGRYGSTVVAWSHSSTVQVGFALSQSSHVHTLCACLLAGLAGRGSAGLQVFQPAISSLDSRVVQQTITNNDKDIPRSHPFIPTRPDHQSRPKQTHSAGASGRPCVCQIRACTRILHDSSRKKAVEWRSVGHTRVRYGSL